MMKVRNLGRKSLDEVMEKLHAIGLNLEKSDDLHMLHSANYLLDDDDDF